MNLCEVNITKHFRNLLVAVVFVVGFFAFSVESTNAAPTVSSVSGTISDGQSLIVYGSSFGATGPTVVMFDDFEGGTNGNSLSLNLAKVGAWSSLNGNPARSIYSSTNKISGNLSARFEMPDGDISNPAIGVETGSTFNSFYASWWSMIPAGNVFPGTGHQDGKNWKQVWAATDSWAGGDTGLWENDFDWISWGSNQFPTTADHYSYWNGTDWTRENLSGSPSRTTIALKPDYVGEGASIQAGQWARWQMWRKGSPDPDIGRQVVWQTKPNTGTVKYRDNLEATFASSANINTNDRISVNAYMRETPASSGISQPTWDDVYLAVGEYAQARVEIGNASTYTACTQLTVVTPTSWSDSSIVGVVRQGAFADGATAYLYVIDADGGISSSRQVSFGSGSSDTTAPNMPSGLTVA